MPPKRKPEYTIGYRKPPSHTRFAKGRSGNPRGRPKGEKNLDTLIARALDELVLISENGRRRTITKLEAIIAQLTNKAAKAELPAIKLLLGYLADLERRADPDPTEPTLSPTDADVIASIMRRAGNSPDQDSSP